MANNNNTTRIGCEYKKKPKPVVEKLFAIHPDYPYCIICCNCEYIIAHTFHREHQDIIYTQYVSKIHIYTFTNKLGNCPQCGDMTDVYPVDSPYYLNAKKASINKPRKKPEHFGSRDAVE